jgi:hypothetical protein
MRPLEDGDEIYAEICKLRAKKLNMIQIAEEMGLGYIFVKNVFYTRSPRIQRLHLTNEQLRSIFEYLKQGKNLTDWHRDNKYPSSEGHLRKIVRKKGLSVKEFDEAKWEAVIESNT